MIRVKGEPIAKESSVSRAEFDALLARFKQLEAQKADETLKNRLVRLEGELARLQASRMGRNVTRNGDPEALRNAAALRQKRYRERQKAANGS